MNMLYEYALFGEVVIHHAAVSPSLPHSLSLFLSSPPSLSLSHSRSLSPSLSRSQSLSQSLNCKVTEKHNLRGLIIRGWMDGWNEGWMDERTEGQMGRQVAYIGCTKTIIFPPIYSHTYLPRHSNWLWLRLSSGLYACVSVCVCSTLCLAFLWFETSINTCSQ